MTSETNRSWYRQIWPWLLMVPPAAAVLGGAITLYLALTSPNELIRDDCYRDGVTMRCGDQSTTGENSTAGQEGAPPPPQ
jgi:hypothetical protein